MKFGRIALLVCCCLHTAVAQPADALTSEDAGTYPVALNGSVRSGYFSASRKLDGARDVLAGSLWLTAKAKLPGGALVAEGWARHESALDRSGGVSTALLREAYLDFHSGSTDVRVGHQIISWGRADEINPTDRLTPRDYTLLTPNSSDQRRGLLAARATQHFALASVTAIWMPGSRPNTLPLAPARGISYVSEAASRSPQGAVKIEHTGGDIDASLSYFSGHDPDPDLAINARGSTGVVLALRQPRVKVLGVDAATTIGGLSLRAEAAYTWAAAASRDDPLAKKSYFFAVVGGDMDVATATNVNLQYIVRRVTDYRDPRLVSDTGLRAIAVEQAVVSGQLDRLQHGISFRLAHRWMNDTWQAELLGVYSLSYRDVVLRPKLVHAISDRWKATLGADIFRGGSQTYFGRLRDLSLAYAELSFAF